MNRSLIGLLGLIFVMISDCASADGNGTLEIRSSAFFPSSNRFREVFGNVGATYGIEASIGTCNCIDAWVDMDLFAGKHSGGRCCKSKINILNTSLGLKYAYPICCNGGMYLGIGPSFSWIYLQNKSFCERKDISKLAIGGVIKSGAYYEFCQSWYIDIFVDYIYQPVKIGKNIDIGGVKLGLGLGTRF